MTRTTQLIGGILVAAGLVITGCSSSGKSSKSSTTTPTKQVSKMETGAKKSLYERLGGKPAIELVVADFVGRAAADPKVNFTRQGTSKPWNATPENVDHLKKMLVEQICAVSGGPCTYTGKDMKTAHHGMMITDAEFEAIAVDLKLALDKYKVGPMEQGELLGAITKMKGDIVGH